MVPFAGSGIAHKQKYKGEVDMSERERRIIELKIKKVLDEYIAVSAIYDHNDIKELDKNQMVVDLINGESFRITIEEYK